MTFDIQTVAEIATPEVELKAKLTFDTEDYSKPLDVTFTDPRTLESVTIPAALWPFVRDAIAAKWEQ